MDTTHPTSQIPRHQLRRLACAALVILYSTVLPAKSACSPSIYCSSSYLFDSNHTGLVSASSRNTPASGYAELWDNEGPVRRIDALQRVESVRSLRTGQRIHLTGSPVASLGTPDHASLNVLATSHYGINNLPKQAQDSIAQLLGQAPKLLAGMLRDLQRCASPVQAIGVHLGAHSDAHLGAQQADSPSIHYLSSYGIDSEPAVTSTACAPLPLDHSAALAQAQAIGYANVCELLEGQVP